MSGLEKGIIQFSLPTTGMIDDFECEFLLQHPDIKMQEFLLPAKSAKEEILNQKFILPCPFYPSGTKKSSGKRSSVNGRM